MVTSNSNGAIGPICDTIKLIIMVTKIEYLTLLPMGGPGGGGEVEFVHIFKESYLLKKNLP